MTDEEIAEEYYYKTYPTTLNIGEEERKKEVADIFLAGLKAGRPQWHDLREDKNDLPKKYDTILVCTEDIDLHRLFLLCNYHYDKWWFADGKTLDDVIAWCEIPTFDKE